MSADGQFFLRGPALPDKEGPRGIAYPENLTAELNRCFWDENTLLTRKRQYGRVLISVGARGGENGG